jgi:DNA-binding transcriptional regulator GbsR (MarR family)
MTGKTTNLEQDIREFGTGLFESLGMDNLTAQLLATLYLSPREMSMEELSQKTGYSLSSVSNKLSRLEAMWVQHIKKPGTKKVFYYMEKDLVRINQRKIKAVHEHHIRQIKTFIPSLMEKYKNASLTKEEEEMMKNAREYYNQALRLEKILEEFGKYLEKEWSTKGT